MSVHRHAWFIIGSNGRVIATGEGDSAVALIIDFKNGETLEVSLIETEQTFEPGRVRVMSPTGGQLDVRPRVANALSIGVVKR